MRHALQLVAVSLLLLLGSCPQRGDLVKKKTGERLAEQYEFENTYTDMGDM